MTDLIPQEKYNQIVDCDEAKVRVNLKRELRKLNVSYNKLETTDSLRKKYAQAFENIKNLAELRALSEYSIENPLTDQQYKRIMELKEKVLGV